MAGKQSPIPLTLLNCRHLITPPCQSTVFRGLYRVLRVSPPCFVTAAWYAACSRTSSLSG
jgi:hypothetical protein